MSKKVTTATQEPQQGYPVHVTSALRWYQKPSFRKVTVITGHHNRRQWFGLAYDNKIVEQWYGNSDSDNEQLLYDLYHIYLPTVQIAQKSFLEANDPFLSVFKLKAPRVLQDKVSYTDDQSYNFIVTNVNGVKHADSTATSNKKKEKSTAVKKVVTEISENIKEEKQSTAVLEKVVVNTATKKTKQAPISHKVVPVVKSK